jgi:uncharacterized protein YndB with AHSA1/START domain
MTTTTKQFQLDRVLTIGARPETVFSFFTDSTRWAAWWGAGSTIDPRPGGRVLVVHPGGVEASGEVLEIVPPERIVFSYGYASGNPVPPGASRVTIRLAAHADGTELHLTHEFDDEGARDQHVQGWRFQLSLFANAVASLVNADATIRVDGWFSAWHAADSVARRSVLERIVTPEIRFADKFSRTDGIDELDAHLDAARRFMPGIELKRNGIVRHCQGSVLSDWVAMKGEKQISHGTNLFQFNADGMIQSVTGFWAEA